MQGTWKTFTSMAAALNGTRGQTRSSIDLVSKNLFLGETVALIATSSVNDFGAWNDGSVIVTDRRLIVSYGIQSLQQVLALTLDIPPAPSFNELQSNSTLRQFIVPGISVQALTLTAAQYDEVEAALRDCCKASASVLEETPLVEDPVESLATLKKLLDRGLVSEEDYQNKKREILDRL